MLLALVICVGYMMRELNFNISSAWQHMAAQNYTRVFATDAMKPNFFLKQLVGGAFITIAMTGLDQEMMQKNISVSNLKDAQKNMLLFGFVQMVVVFIFLLLGALLTLYATAKGLNVQGDNLFPSIAVNTGLPFFITVLFLIGLISALFPSADGALTALTSSFCIDILGLKRKIEWQEKKRAQVRHIVHISFAVLFLLCIFFFRSIDNGSLIDILLKVAGFTYGPLLGLFSFGIFTKRNVSEKLPLIICLVALLVTLLIDFVNNAEWYFKTIKLAPDMTKSILQLSDQIFHGYRIGIELLIINAALTFGLLFLCSFKMKKETPVLP